MIISTIRDVCRMGDFHESQEWLTACAEVEQAIAVTDWPVGTGSFKIQPKPKGNGVKPIKLPCVARLRSDGWQTETLPQMGEVLTPGDLDALRVFPDTGLSVGFEWETGNISSSHRAMNKLLMTIQDGYLRGGILVMPVRALARYLTDRVGNFEELEPYFPLYAKTVLEHGGALRLIGIEHDTLDPEVPLIPKGTDGRALV